MEANESGISSFEGDAPTLSIAQRSLNTEKEARSKAEAVVRRPSPPAAASPRSDAGSERARARCPECAERACAVRRQARREGKKPALSFWLAAEAFRHERAGSDEFRALLRRIFEKSVKPVGKLSCLPESTRNGLLDVLRAGAMD